ncbi:DMT family transporter [Saccharopolyspora sp. 6M]|uniref:DMT family transporter n=1 Tax=Saccharopolyspora sp. 6M TaxID=2877237 RepID=UPI001CD1E6ED|nr:DMT family transporter [Saccharopolyspora sp. 6M]MCA1225265.1 DMT family transporter [Saccharopolyspora sp. 6M]
MNHRTSHLRLGVLALLWGASFLLIKLALTAMSPAQVTFTRIALGAAVLVALCAVRGLRMRLDRRLLPHVVVAGFFASALPWVLLGIGERTVDSGLAGAVNATTPLWTLLFGYVLGARGGFSPRMLGGLAVGFGGVLLILAPWQGASAGTGVLACLAAAASYGVGYVHIGRKLTGTGAPAPVLAALQLAAATGLAAVVLPLEGLPAVRFDAVALLAVAVLGVFGTGVGFALNYRLIADEGATVASTVTYLMPVVSVLLGWLVLGERLSWRVLLGIALVLAGVALTRNRTARPRPARGPAAGAPADRAPDGAPRVAPAHPYTDLATNHPMK